MKRLVPLVILVLAAIGGALRAANMRALPGDFLRYHRAGRLVATGRAELIYDEAFLELQSVYAGERTATESMREMEFKYAPAMAVMMAPLGALPARAANTIWGALNTVLIAAMCLVAWRWCAAGLSPWWMLVPLAVLWRTIQSNIVLGQLNTIAITSATAGLWLLSRGKDKAAGALVGVGAVVKYMPGLLVVWLAWKRRWSALAASLGVVVALGVVLPAVVLGPVRSIDIAKTWIDVRLHHYTAADEPDLPGYSVKSFVYRVFGDTPYITFTGDDGGETNIVVGAAVLPPAGLRAVYVAINVLLLAASLWFSRGALRGANDPRGPPESSLLLAVLPLVSPEARFPHFMILALPLTALVYALVRDREPTMDAGDVHGETWQRRTALVLGAAGVACVNATWGKLVGGDDVGRMAEVYCVPGWGALAIGVALVLVTHSRAAPRQTGVS